MTTARRPKPKPTSWLWTNYIPVGEVTTMYGEGGVGKTFAAVSIALSVAESLPMPDGSEPGVTGNVLVVSQEHTSDQITGRVEAALDGRLSEHVIAYGNDLDPVSFPRDIDVLRELIVSQRLRLVVLDPLAMLSNANLNRMDQVRKMVFTPLSRLMAETKCTCIIIHHVNKGGADVSATNKSAGSKAIIDASRAAYMVSKGLGGGKSVLLPVKSNHGREQAALQFEIDEYAPLGVGYVSWQGEVHVKKTDLMPRFGPQAAVMSEAIDMLREMLSEGRVHTSAVLGEAAKRGISVPTLNRARARLGVRSIRIGSEFYVEFPGVLESKQPVKKVARKLLVQKPTAQPKRKLTRKPKPGQ